jgi:hypothetical protein
MATRVLLTIDTELTWRHFARGADWRENWALSFNPAGVGVPWQLELLARHGLKACFFVDPMPALVYGIEPIRLMVEPILAAGQEVQLHLHPFWWDLAHFRREERFELTSFDAEEQRGLIETARDLLIQAGAPPPTAFRAGSYAADVDTLDALRALGIFYDSSHNGAEHPWPSALPLHPTLIDPAPAAGVTELPIAQIRRRDGGLRPFQLCALSQGEMVAALRHAAEHQHPLVTIVSHSFELASRDGRRVNRLVRRRFERLCAFLDENRAAMPTMAIGDLPPFPADARSDPLPAQRLRTAQRLAEQAWGNMRYERPAFASALLAAPVLAAWMASYASV